MSGTFSPPPQVSDPDMHHGTCVMHVPWCIPGSLTSGFLWGRLRGKRYIGIPGACAIRHFTYLVRDPLLRHQCHIPGVWTVILYGRTILHWNIKIEVTQRIITSVGGTYDHSIIGRNWTRTNNSRICDSGPIPKHYNTICRQSLMQFVKRSLQWLHKEAHMQKFNPIKLVHIRCVMISIQ